MWFVLLLVTIGTPGVVLSGKCPHRVSPKNLTASFGLISTPNFPSKFETPYCDRWVIDSGPVNSSNPKIIHLYYTQPYYKLMTSPYFVVEFHDVYPFEIYPRRVRKSGSGRVKRYAGSNFARFRTDHPHNLRGPLTALICKERYLSIEVRIDSLYNTHFRARDDFLNGYGFNLTYEINNATRSRKNTCSIYSCMAAGNCYAAKDYKSFFCGCGEGRSGDHCEFSPICNPAKNINPCQNGGQCLTMGLDSVTCACPPGFEGRDCSRRKSTAIKVCPGPDCRKTCDLKSPVPNPPCSCYNGTRPIPGGWVRYEADFAINTTKQLNEVRWDKKSGNGKRDKNASLNEDLQVKVGIESHLTTRLRDLLRLPARMDNAATTARDNPVSLISVGPGSIQFEFFGPPDAFNETEQALRDISGEEVYTEIHLLPSFKLRFIPRLELEDLSMKPGGTIREHDNYSITCSAIGSSKTVFKWFKDNVPIEPSLSLWGRITEILWKEENSFRRTSMLNFDKAHVNDRGIFTCQVSDEDEVICKDFQIDILAKPNINLNTMSLTILKNTRDTIITCAATLDDSNWIYDWAIDGEPIGAKHTNEVKEDLFPRGSLLRILKAEVSKTYTCIVANGAGEDRSDVRVEVLDSANSPSCPEQVDHSVSRLRWDMTAPNQTAKRLCPDGYVGFAQRTCQPMGIGLQPEWGDPDFSKCVNLELKAVDRSVQNAKLGFTDRSHLPEMARLIATYMKTKGFLYLGEGERVIAILNDLGTYAMEKGLRTDTEFFELFLNTTSLFLTFPQSCFYERSVIALCNLLHKMATHYSSSIEFSFHSETLIVEGPKMSSNSSALVYPGANYPINWQLDFSLQIPNTSGTETTFTLVLLKNLTFPVTPRERLKSKNPHRLISPVAYIDSKTYQFHQNRRITLRFKISKEWARLIAKKEMNFTCASLDNNPDQSMSWQRRCMETISNGVVECLCDRLGQYGVLTYPIVEGESNQSSFPTIHWSVLLGCIVCISFTSLALVTMLCYTHCQVLTNSIYLLKIVICFSLIISVLFSLSLRAAATSIPLAATLCTLLLLSLSSHVTVSLKIFLSSRRGYEWLRSVPLVNLLFSITFTSILPLWTCATAMLSASWDDAGALDESSPLFGTFMSTLVLILLAFMGIYVKTSMALRRERTFVDSGKLHGINYRLKSLNWTFAILISTMLMGLSGILHNNTSIVVYQYLYALSTFVLGILVLFGYTVKSEYPIPNCVARHLVVQPEFPDPEKPYETQSCRSPLKQNSAERQVGSVLLQIQDPRRRSGSRHSSENEAATMETFAGSSISSKVQPSSSFNSTTSNGNRRPSLSLSLASRLRRSSAEHKDNLSHPYPPPRNPILPEHCRPFLQHLEWNNSNLPHDMKKPERELCRLGDTTTCIRLPPALIYVPPPSPPWKPCSCISEYVEPSIRPSTQTNGPSTSRQPQQHQSKPIVKETRFEPIIENSRRFSSHFCENDEAEFYVESNATDKPKPLGETLSFAGKPLSNGSAHNGANYEMKLLSSH